MRLKIFHICYALENCVWSEYYLFATVTKELPTKLSRPGAFLVSLKEKQWFVVFFFFFLHILESVLDIFRFPEQGKPFHLDFQIYWNHAAYNISWTFLICNFKTFVVMHCGRLNKIPSQGIRVLNPGNHICQPVRQKGLIDAIKLRILKWEAYHGLTKWLLRVITEVLVKGETQESHGRKRGMWWQKQMWG